jgi:hypothetical protein
VQITSTSGCYVEGGQTLTVSGARLGDVSAVRFEFVSWSTAMEEWTTMMDAESGLPYLLSGENVAVQSAAQLTFTSPCASRESMWKSCAAPSGGGALACGFRVVLTTNSSGVDGTDMVLQQPMVAYRSSYSYDALGSAWVLHAAHARGPVYVCYEAPLISEVLPKTVQPGSIVVITGSHFGARRPDCGSPAPYFAIEVGPTVCRPGECANEILAWSDTRIEFRVSGAVPSGEQQVTLAVGGNSATPIVASGARTINVQNENIVPRALAFVSGTTTRANIKWLPPISSIALQRYVVMWSSDPNDETFTSGHTRYLPLSTTTYALEPLVLDTTYRVRVVAEHAQANGTASDIFIQHSVEADAPTWLATPVTFVSYTGGTVRAVASFNAPRSWNGGVADSYVLEWSDTTTTPPEVHSKTVAVSSSRIQSELLTGLLPHRQYNLTVMATTRALRGPASTYETIAPGSTLWESAPAMASPLSAVGSWRVTVPAQPTSLQLSYLDAPTLTNLTHDVTLAWSAPEASGNAPIEDYAITYTARATAWSSGENVSFPLIVFSSSLMAQTVVTQLTIPAIRFGLPICFTVAAQNAIGVGASTATGTTTTCTCGASFFLDATDAADVVCRPCGAACDFCQAYGEHKCNQCAFETTLEPSSGQCVAFDRCGEGELPKPTLASDPSQGFHCVSAGLANVKCGFGERIVDGVTCAPCPFGSYSDLSGADAKMRCKACASGTFTAQLGASACTLCSEGTVTRAAASSACALCMLGKFNAKPGLTAHSCDECAHGRYAAARGATVCRACYAGFFASATGQPACVGCEIGTFAATGGLSSCAKCADGKYAINKASVCWTCVADAGYLCIAGTLKVGEGYWFDATKTHVMRHVDGTRTEYLCPGEVEGAGGGANACPHECDVNGDQCAYVEQSTLYECPEESSGANVCEPSVASAEDLAAWIVVPAANGTNASRERLAGSLEGANVTVSIPSMNCTNNARGVLCQLCKAGFRRGRLGCVACESSPVLLGFNSGQWLINAALAAFASGIFLLSLCCMRNTTPRPKLYETVHTIVVLKWFLRSKVVPTARALVERKRRARLGFAPEPAKKALRVADKKHIKIVVASARHLTATGRGGKSDPFVKVFWRPTSSHSWVDMGKATKALSNTLNPVWNKTFTLRTRKGLEPQVKLEVWDDGPTGHVIYTLDSQGPSTGWANIEGASGQLQAQVGYAPFASQPQLPCYETRSASCYVLSATNMAAAQLARPTYVKLLTRPDVSCSWTDTSFCTSACGARLGTVDWGSKFTFTAVVGAQTAARLLLCDAENDAMLGYVDLGLAPTQHGFHEMKLEGELEHAGDVAPLLRAAVGFGDFSAKTLEEDTAARHASLEKASHAAHSAAELSAAGRGGAAGHVGAAVVAAERRRLSLNRFKRAARNVMLHAATTAALAEDELRAVADGTSDGVVTDGVVGVVETNVEGRVADAGAEADLGDIEGDGALGIGTSDVADAMRGDFSVINNMAGDASGVIEIEVDVGGTLNSIVASLVPIRRAIAQQWRAVYMAGKAVYDPVMSQWKVLLGNIQILSSMQVVFASVPWPEDYLSMLNGLEIFKFDLFSSFKGARGPCARATSGGGRAAAPTPASASAAPHPPPHSPPPRPITEHRPAQWSYRASTSHSTMASEPSWRSPSSRFSRCS